MKFTNVRFPLATLVAGALAVAALLLSPMAKAQPAQFDIYAATRPILLSGVGNSVVYGTPNVTNGPVDLFGYVGRGFVEVFSSTNGGGVLAAGLEFSQDTTNWFQITNYSWINGPAATNTLPYTNYYFGGTNLVVSNAYLAPVNISNAVPNLWGFAGNYGVQSGAYAFTNTATTQLVTRAGIYTFGFNVQNQRGRYMHIFYQGSGSVTNATVGSKFYGIRDSEIQ